MKRVLPSLLVCLLSLFSGPGLQATTLSALVLAIHGANSASIAESLLPACCRRHGAHHCAMQMAQTALRDAQDKGQATLSTPDTCPCFPHTQTSSAPVTPAVLTRTAIFSNQHTDGRLASGRVLHPRFRQLSKRFNRGPPATTQV